MEVNCIMNFEAGWLLGCHFRRVLLPVWWQAPLQRASPVFLDVPASLEHFVFSPEFILCGNPQEALIFSEGRPHLTPPHGQACPALPDVVLGARKLWPSGQASLGCRCANVGRKGWNTYMQLAHSSSIGQSTSGPLSSFLRGYNHSSHTLLACPAVPSSLEKSLSSSSSCVPGSHLIFFSKLL